MRRVSLSECSGLFCVKAYGEDDISMVHAYYCRHQLHAQYHGDVLYDGEGKYNDALLTYATSV